MEAAERLLDSPSLPMMAAGVLGVLLLILVGVLLWLVKTRSKGDMGLAKKANRFKELDGYLNEAKKWYRANITLRELYAVASKSGVAKKFVRGILAAAENGGLSGMPEESARWLAQAITLEPSNAEAYYQLGLVAVRQGKATGQQKWMRLAHQSFTKAFLLERGHIPAFQQLILLSEQTESFYVERTKEGLAKASAMGQNDVDRMVAAAQAQAYAEAEAAEARRQQG
ncbi:MAG: tetratricopeptide repeat protein [Candidatus Sericytochromatia bacterium]|nr:tetratricopeptide repeat protein [Candidatus Sericytochromatia bacterium]